MKLDLCRISSEYFVKLEIFQIKKKEKRKKCELEQKVEQLGYLEKLQPHTLTRALHYLIL